MSVSCERTSSAGRDAVLAAVPEDIGRRLAIFADLLQRWQATINLIAPSTLANLWIRHIADSLQVHDALPDARRWVDFGSGGGFPGLVTAIRLTDMAAAHVHLVESDKRKAAFLRTAIRETGAPASVHADRIEDFVTRHGETVDAVSARALAPLPRLVAYAARFLEAGAIGVFPTGETGAAELTGFDADHRFTIRSVPSRVREGSSLLIVRVRTGGAAGGD